MSYIRLDTKTAEELAVALIGENHGADMLAPQRPFEAIDKNDNILVKGTFFQDFAKGQSFSASHVIFSKEDAEILDFGCTGRLTLSPEQENIGASSCRPTLSLKSLGHDAITISTATDRRCGCSRQSTVVS